MLLTEKPTVTPFSQEVVSTSPSPLKPRLIWRGALHLQDGSALQGIAFVSNSQPSFSTSSHSLRTSSLDSSALEPPLTLSKEQQDALSLSIEMIRHAPINIVEVVEKVDKDDEGTLVRPKRTFTSNHTREQNDNIKVSYQAGGGIRMYVDPAFPSTVAYMERIFCYDDEIDEEESESISNNKHSRLKDSNGSANKVIVLSLDKSFRYSLDPLSKDQDDVFTEDAMSAWNNLRSSTAGVIEAVVLGKRVKKFDGSTSLELHVGQKVISKAPIRESNKSSSSMLVPASQKSMNTIGVRPDDPAPRGLSRVLSEKYRSTPNLHTQKATSSSLSSSSSPFATPAPPLPLSHRSSFTSLHRPPLSSTSDGDIRSTSMPTLKRESSTLTTTLSSKADIKRVKIDQDDSTIDTKIQERNRSLIKKLVHHQLLGRGVEKSDENYLTCFGPTCNGTVLAFKKHIKMEAIDKLKAAIIVEKHLDMYL